MKTFLYILWIVLIFIGSFTVSLVPDAFHYIYGFIFGSITFGCLWLAKKIDD